MVVLGYGDGVSIWQNKNPTAGWQWGSLKLAKSEPDCHATQQQRAKQQVKIQVAIHAPHGKHGQPTGQFQFWFCAGNVCHRNVNKFDPIISCILTGQY